MTLNSLFALLIFSLWFVLIDSAKSKWQIGPIEKYDSVNPILRPTPNSTFYCPVQKQVVSWEAAKTCCGSPVVRNGKIFLVYSAVSTLSRNLYRIGLASSQDGIHFERSPVPVLYPDLDEYQRFESSCGCMSPQVVETEDGNYIMTYNACAGVTSTYLFIASSPDLLSWTKHGSAFSTYNNGSSFSLYTQYGSIASRRHGSRVIAEKINGKYWMYYTNFLNNVYSVYLATSDNLIDWTPMKNENGEEHFRVFGPRADMFDSAWTMPASPPIISDDGIVLIYNYGKGYYTGGSAQVLLSLREPWNVVERANAPFLTGDRDYEMSSGYNTTYAGGLSYFQLNNQSSYSGFLHYYTAFSSQIAVAVFQISPQFN